MKLENVNRVKRIQEYKRLETLRRIHEGDKRIAGMMDRKTEIVETRKKNALQVKGREHSTTTQELAIICSDCAHYCPSRRLFSDFGLTHLAVVHSACTHFVQAITPLSPHLIPSPPR